MAPAIFKVVQFENAAAFKIACLDSAAVRSEERARLYNSLISFRTSSRDLISGFQHMRSQSSFLFLLVFVDFTFGVRVCSRLPEVLDRLLVQTADPQSVPQFIPQFFSSSVRSLGRFWLSGRPSPLAISSAISKPKITKRPNGSIEQATS